jgi:hypothetical protein
LNLRVRQENINRTGLVQERALTSALRIKAALRGEDVSEIVFAASLQLLEHVRTHVGKQHPAPAFVKPLLQVERERAGAKHRALVPCLETRTP